MIRQNEFRQFNIWQLNIFWQIDILAEKEYLKNKKEGNSRVTVLTYCIILSKKRKIKQPKNIKIKIKSFKVFSWTLKI